MMMICSEVTYAGWIPMLQNLRQNFLSPNLQLDLLVPQERFQDQIFPPLNTQRWLKSVQYDFNQKFNTDAQELRRKY